MMRSKLSAVAAGSRSVRPESTGVIRTVAPVGHTRARQRPGIVGIVNARSLQSSTWTIPTIPGRPEPLLGLRRNRAVRSRADVEQQIRPLPRGFHEIMDEIAQRFVVVIGEVEAPRIVHRERRLER